MNTFTETYLTRLSELLETLPVDSIERAVDIVFEAYEHDRQVFVMGNGGSAAASSHFVCDLAKGTCVPGARRLRALCLTDNVPLLTAWANDTHYTNIFGEILRNLVTDGDLLVGCTASGRSPNILNAMRVAREAGAHTMALVGYDGGAVRDLVDHCVIIPSENITQIEDVQMLLFHLIASAVRQRIACSVGYDESTDNRDCDT